MDQNVYHFVDQDLASGAMQQESRYLEFRAGHWHYNRRVALQRAEQSARKSQEADQRANLLMEQLRTDAQVAARRDEKRLTGLAKTLSEVSGFAFLQGKFFDFQDRRRAEEHRRAREALDARLRDLRMAEEHRERLELMELRRKEAALERTFT